MRLLIGGLCAAFFVSASAAAPVWNLYRGTAIVKPRVDYVSLEACLAARPVGSGTYTCRTIVAAPAPVIEVRPPPVVNPPVTPPDMTGMVHFDPAKIPARGIGSSTADLTFTGELPRSSDIGNFRTVCHFSHMLMDDPIVAPGKPGGSHLHAFFGNTLADAFSTAESLMTTGNSTCRGGTVNRSAYWMPAMIDTGTGAPVRPTTLIPYYKTGYSLDPASMKPFPAGLRMLAGNPKQTTVPQWGPTNFTCINTARGNGPRTWHLPTDCPVGDTLWINVTFPQCWDGVNVDSPDHRSHMAYPKGASCPATHPIALPEVALQFLYLVTDAQALKRWRLASDAYEGPAGYSMHADYFFAWDQKVLERWVQKCDVEKKDCAAHMLGDGWIMNEAKP
jgi:hypothetical protein